MKTAFALLLAGALCVAIAAACVVVQPTALTIGCLAFTVLMFCANFAFWRAQQ